MGSITNFFELRMYLAHWGYLFGGHAGGAVWELIVIPKKGTVYGDGWEVNLEVEVAPWGKPTLMNIFVLELAARQHMTALDLEVALRSAACMLRSGIGMIWWGNLRGVTRMTKSCPAFNYEVPKSLGN